MTLGTLRFRSKWREFWAEQTAPPHREATPDHYRRYAQELVLGLPERTFRMVPDVGCGNGGMSELLGFNQLEYTGIDCSESMIATFAQRCPQLRLVVANADEYLDYRQYDLFFCDAVVQYLAIATFDRWLGMPQRCWRKTVTS